MLINKSKEIIVEVTQEQHDEQIASGLTEDEVLKPGRHVFRRGGFRERHPNFSSETIEINIIEDDQENQFSAANDNEKKAA